MRPDLPQRLSDTCVRAMLAALALSVLAIGIINKLNAAPAFDAYARFEQAWPYLRLELKEVTGSRCWSLYKKRLPRGVDSMATTIRQLQTIECGADTGNYGSVQGGEIPTNDARHAWRPSTPHLQTPVTPHTSRNLSAPPRPMPPSDLHVWMTPPGTDSLERTLNTLWSSALLARALKYDNATAQEDVYRWEVTRSHLQQVTSRNPQSIMISFGKPKPSEPYSHLTISELVRLATTGHPPLSSLDQAMHEDFRASLPNGLLSVSLGTAALAVSAGIALFMTVFAAYVRTAVRLGVLADAGTIFHALLGWRTLEIFAVFVIATPPVVAVALAIALAGGIHWASIAIDIFTIIAVVSAASAARQAWPLTELYAIFSRHNA